MVPLWLAPLQQIAAEIAHVLPNWSAVEVASASRYLGYMVGPGKGTKSWDKAIAKFTARACLWGSQSLGLQYAAKTYNTFAMSVLTFLSQLEEPPSEAFVAETKALRRAAPGPGNWASSEDLWYLKECYGQTVGFQSLKTMALAAKVRVATYEPLSLPGKSLRRRAYDLRVCMNGTEKFDRLARWSCWYNASPVFILTAAVNEFVRMGFAIDCVQQEVAGKAKRPWSAEVALKVKQGVQRMVARKIHQRHRPDAVARVRAKLARWNLPDPELHCARCVARRLTQLRSLVAPRVCAAVLSAVWIRWTTARRFQKRSDTCNACVLGCHGSAEDSIEHYSRCSAVRACAAKFLRLNPQTVDLQQFVFADKGPVAEDELVCRALLVYATYRATNHYRSVGTCPCSGIAADALAQHCKNGVQGHIPSRRVLDGRWSDGPSVPKTHAEPTRKRRRLLRAEATVPEAPAAAGRSSIEFMPGRSLVTGLWWQH